jgi:hypothetical protein
MFADGLRDKFGRGTNQIQAAFGFEFFNSLNTTVIAMTRTGVKYHIPPLPGASFKGFVVRTNYHAKGGVNVDTHDLWNDSGHATTAEAELIAKVVTRDDTKVKAGQFPHFGTIDYLIQYSDFADYGGSVYLPNLDLTLSILPVEDAPPHPYSMVGLRHAAAGEVVELTERKGLTYQIRIIDRLGRFGDRYANLGGEVFHIKAERNCADMQCGVYAVSNYPANGDQSLPQARTRYFKFDDASEQLHLYYTFNEAKTLGNPQDVYKRELDDKAHQQSCVNRTGLGRNPSGNGKRTSVSGSWNRKPTKPSCGCWNGKTGFGHGKKTPRVRSRKTGFWSNAFAAIN